MGTSSGDRRRRRASERMSSCTGLVRIGTDDGGDLDVGLPDAGHPVDRAEVIDVRAGDRGRTWRDR